MSTASRLAVLVGGVLLVLLALAGSGVAMASQATFAGILLVALAAGALVVVFTSLQFG